MAGLCCVWRRFAGGLDERRGEAHRLHQRQRVARRGRAGAQLVVKLHLAAAHLLAEVVVVVVTGEQLRELEVVRCGQHEAVFPRKVLERGLRGGDALDGVRSAQDLVDEHVAELPGLGIAQDAPQREQLGHEIARARKDAVAHGDGREHRAPAQPERAREARVERAREDAVDGDRLEERRLARCVRAGEERAAHKRRTVRHGVVQERGGTGR